ncbi:hypothetical protein LXA43DRAFT_31000 [Ganoderma leucocontextum]|nr:hypothetical protein LXA43DRAFT_31000 [Ganoderma leucocontextum]
MMRLYTTTSPPGNCQSSAGPSFPTTGHLFSPPEEITARIVSHPPCTLSRRYASAFLLHWRRYDRFGQVGRSFEDRNVTFTLFNLRLSAEISLDLPKWLRLGCGEHPELVQGYYAISQPSNSRSVNWLRSSLKDFLDHIRLPELRIYSTWEDCPHTSNLNWVVAIAETPQAWMLTYALEPGVRPRPPDSGSRLRHFPLSKG